MSKSEGLSFDRVAKIGGRNPDKKDYDCVRNIFRKMGEDSLAYSSGIKVSEDIVSKVNEIL